MTSSISPESLHAARSWLLGLPCSTLAVSDLALAKEINCEPNIAAALLSHFAAHEGLLQLSKYAECSNCGDKIKIDDGCSCTVLGEDRMRSAGIECPNCGITLTDYSQVAIAFKITNLCKSKMQSSDNTSVAKSTTPHRMMSDRDLSEIDRNLSEIKSLLINNPRYQINTGDHGTISLDSSQNQLSNSHRSSGSVSGVQLSAQTEAVSSKNGSSMGWIAVIIAAIVTAVGAIIAAIVT